jgi:hypothetical protein
MQREWVKIILPKLLRARLAEFFGAFVSEELAGAEGFEPSPSTLTVWCPTGWTTPQRHSATAEIARIDKLGSAAMRGEGFT